MNSLENERIIEVKESEKERITRLCFFSGTTALLCISALSFLKILLFDNISLSQFGLVPHIVLSFVYAIFLFGAYSHIYFNRNNISLSPKKVWAITFVIILCYTICIACSLLNINAMPLLLCAILVTVLVDGRIAFVTSVLTSLIVLWTLAVGWHFNKGYEFYSLLTIALVSSLGSALIVNRLSSETQRLRYIFSLIWVGALTSAGLLAGDFLSHYDLNLIFRHFPYFFIGVALQVFLGMILQPVFESIFNLLTNQRLVELTDYKQPLLLKLHKEAPGTFNHCLSVANLAETCATAIGVNPYMTKAAAFYHDVGKLKNVAYFTENQGMEYNPHDDLMPEVSRDIIINHTFAGYNLCKEYHIPKEIADVTIEHHGTLPIALFYNKAKQLTDGEVDIKQYMYSGALPSTKVAALIMICDACEAAIRSISKPTGQKVDDLVKTIINFRLFSGQFENCDITMRDLSIIRKTIVDAFGGLYHTRISYDNKN